MARYLALAPVLALFACGETGAPTAAADGGTSDAGHGHEDIDASVSDAGASLSDAQPSTLDAPADVDAGPPPAFQAIDPCGAPGDYVDATYVSAYDSNRYDPPCLRVRAGVAVTIEASDDHPLAARSGGSPGSPIPSSSTSTDTTVTFDTPGFYPYVCVAHAGLGMLGVVQVVP